MRRRKASNKSVRENKRETGINYLLLTSINFRHHTHHLIYTLRTYDDNRLIDNQTIRKSKSQEKKRETKTKQITLTQILIVICFVVNVSPPPPFSPPPFSSSLYLLFLCIVELFCIPRV